MSDEIEQARKDVEAAKRKLYMLENPDAITTLEEEFPLGDVLKVDLTNVKNPPVNTAKVIAHGISFDSRLGNGFFDFLDTNRGVPAIELEVTTKLVVPPESLRKIIIKDDDK